MGIHESEALWERALRVIPEGVQTLSKHPSRFVDGVYPKFISEGEGQVVVDPDGNKYIDWTGALGAVIVGHGSVGVDTSGGNVFPLPSPYEVKLAELLCDVVPCAEMVRFGRNGVDSTMAAVRLARGITGRNHILSYGYHGWTDMFACVSPLSDGIPTANRDLITEVPWNDAHALSLELRTKDVACVIVEVPPCPVGEAERYLTDAIALSHRYGALFILDEIVTGFRYSLGGAHELCNVMPDLACIGKAMANGFPISAVVGLRKHMRHFSHVFFSTTFGGEITAIRAALRTIPLVSGGVARIWATGAALMEGLKRVAHKHGVPIVLSGIPPRFIINFPAFDQITSLEIRSLFLQGCCVRGVLFGHAVFPMVSHTLDNVVATTNAAEKAFKVVAKAVKEGSVGKYLLGKVAQGPHIPSRA